MKLVRKVGQFLVAFIFNNFQKTKLNILKENSLLFWNEILEFVYLPS